MKGFWYPFPGARHPSVGNPRGPLKVHGRYLKVNIPRKCAQNIFQWKPIFKSNPSSEFIGVGCGFLIWSVFHGFPLITNPVVVDTDSSCWLSSHAVGRGFENLPLQIHKCGESSTQCASQVLYIVKISFKRRQPLSTIGVGPIYGSAMQRCIYAWPPGSQISK